MYVYVCEHACMRGCARACARAFLQACARGHPCKSAHMCVQKIKIAKT